MAGITGINDQPPIFTIEVEPSLLFDPLLSLSLQVLKSTADVEGGRALYERYSAVSDGGSHNFLCLRETVLQRKEARKMFVQANTRVKG